MAETHSIDAVSEHQPAMAPISTKDLRSASNACRRTRKEVYRYANYKAVDRGLLGQEFYEPTNPDVPYAIMSHFPADLSEAAVVVFDKRRLFKEAQWGRPVRHHHACWWCNRGKPQWERRVQRRMEARRTANGDCVREICEDDGVADALAEKERKESDGRVNGWSKAEAKLVVECDEISGHPVNRSESARDEQSQVKECDRPLGFPIDWSDFEDEEIILTCQTSKADRSKQKETFSTKAPPLEGFAKEPTGVFEDDGFRDMRSASVPRMRTYGDNWRYYHFKSVHRIPSQLREAIKLRMLGDLHGAAPENLQYPEISQEDQWYRPKRYHHSGLDAKGTNPWKKRQGLQKQAQQLVVEDPTGPLEDMLEGEADARLDKEIYGLLDDVEPALESEASLEDALAWRERLRSELMVEKAIDQYQGRLRRAAEDEGWSVLSEGGSSRSRSPGVRGRDFSEDEWEAISAI
ncbi:MAG: hypothetical protein M1819_003431 [Sarea resinae]|nr:MAG: hypothetical protein M1819_003431 [Sarea resinae]